MRLLVFLFLSVSASADTVIFIGGYGSSSANMKCWKKGAEKQAAYAGYKFKTITYPAGVTGYRNAINSSNAASQIAEIVNYINARPNEKFVIAAHSSGSDIAFLAAKQFKNPKNVDYVNLAGWSLPRHMYNLRKVTSISDPSRAAGCKSQTRWCRHFSLVNKTPPSNLDLENLADGYNGCNSNLSWLTPKGREVVAASTDQKSDAAQASPPNVKAPSSPAFETQTGASGGFDDDDSTPTKK